ncbi:hypothetical protein EXU48_11505 [Occultella glacieicola]|uniref:TIGR02646 family protein n=1 Tax=Occultella glacieicola TaxID=2518684 RepID=A0ABY2E371_9MICO|nr:hypothetical protein [Occultella glacieicola]TDE94073.1 hypothetical protein EXU48_11505 [Occultella glacieicola]
MRRVPRPPEPATLSSDRAVRERTRAAAFYATWNGVDKYNKYAIYKAPDVKDALEAAFGFKCAYCESSYLATQPVAVEHYRPKGEVTIDGVRTPPGYYWLASQWDNLLPSCTDCNSPRGQDLPGVRATAGKANAFPIGDEADRATAPGQEAREERLLLHPYLDFPEKHLDFVWQTTGIDEGWVLPHRYASGRTSRKGETTIAVCALQRRGLVETRRRVVRALRGHLESLAFLKEAIGRHPDDQDLRDQFARGVADVATFVADDAPYTAMAKQVVAAYYDRLFPPD